MTDRQQNLFLSEDWKKIYRGFVSINFAAYDYISIRNSLIDYLRQNFSEDFNDFIESSEFIALIDLVSYFGQTLAFRMDLNARENFIDTAERRESILKLARMLSYKPKRPIPIRGLLKITGISSTEDIFDSNGENLNTRLIEWNDANNVDWEEQWNLVLNSAFVKSNPIGRPVQKANFENIKVHNYRINNATLSGLGQFSFSANINGDSLPFEIVNTAIDDSGYSEREPRPDSAFHFVYQTDGKGNQSKNSGWFCQFRQGRMNFKDDLIATYMENRTINHTIENINEYDVWVQTVNDQGSVLQSWTKVPSLVNENIIFNDVKKTIRNVFSVLTNDINGVDIRFGDGRFGEIPSGIIRTWMRQSANSRVIVNKQDIRGLQITIDYTNGQNKIHQLILKMDLQETISNSQGAETNEQIKANAPQLYYTQNRMVNGEDYNLFPKDDPTIVKVKSINRTYSGHSRHMPFQDPTGNYNNINIFSDDGCIYQEKEEIQQEITPDDNLSPEEIITNHIQPLLYDERFEQFLSQEMRKSVEANPFFDILQDFSANPILWKSISLNTGSSTGFFTDQLSSPITIGKQTSGARYYLQQGALVKFTGAGWTTIKSVNGLGNTITPIGEGSVLLNQEVYDSDIIEQIVPSIRKTLNAKEIEEILDVLQFQKTFGLFYDIPNDKWIIKDNSTDILTQGNWDFSLNPNSESSYGNKWLMLIEFNGSLYQPSWRITTRGIRFVFESQNKVQFFVNTPRFTNPNKKFEFNDELKILKFNEKPLIGLAKRKSRYWTQNTNYVSGDFVEFRRKFYQCLINHTSANLGNLDISWQQDYPKWILIEGSLDKDFVFVVSGRYIENSGITEQKKVVVLFGDEDGDGVSDDPTLFDTLVYNRNNMINFLDYVIHAKKEINSNGVQAYYITNMDQFETKQSFIAEYLRNQIRWSSGQPIFIENQRQYYIIDKSKNVTDPEFLILEQTNKYRTVIGRKDLKFQWLHKSTNDIRINASHTNIIDSYVLTTEYDLNFRKWLSNDKIITTKPKPPSVEQLRLNYQKFNKYKMATDHLVWHPVKYKAIIGSKSAEELQAKIKVTRLPNATMSDDEIKTNIIDTINVYFSVVNWDFGETFYFSEMASYIHQTLATNIAGIALVPRNTQSVFGDLQQIKSNNDEIFISSATVDDIDIVDNFNNKTLNYKP